jgi:hypothetical protein
MGRRDSTRAFVVDIFDEVEEDLRAERAQRLLKRYGGVLLALMLAVVAGAGGYEAWRWRRQQHDLAAAAEFLRAMAEADKAGAVPAERAAAIAGFEQVAAVAPAGYATLARLRAAALKADAGDTAGAAASWESVAADGSADPLLRDLATLLWALHQIDVGDPALIRARLQPLTVSGNAWRPLAEEAEALIALRSGDAESARTAFRRLADDAGAPDGVRARAAGLLNRLGG